MSRPPLDPDDDLPRDARLQAALRHAEEATARPSPAVRAQVLAAARAALKPAAPPPAPWRRALQAVLQAAWAPRGQAGLATLAVAGLAVGLWAGRDLPAPMPSAQTPTGVARPPSERPPAPPSAVPAPQAPVMAGTASAPASPQSTMSAPPPPKSRERERAPLPPAPRPEAAAPSMTPAVAQAQPEAAASDHAVASQVVGAQRAKATEAAQAPAAAMVARAAPRVEPPNLRQALGQPGWQIRREAGTDLEPLDDARRERLLAWLQAPGLQPESDGATADALAGGLELQGPQGERVALQRVDGQTLRLLWQGQRWRLREPGAAEAMGLGGP